MKQRFWWSLGDFEEWQDYNFMWTQWKSNKIIEGLKTFKEVTKEKDEKDSLGSTMITDKNDSASSTENLIMTPKRSLSKANNFAKQDSLSKPKPFAAGVAPAKKQDKNDQEPKEENITSHKFRTTSH